VTKSNLFRLSVGLNAALIGVVIWHAVGSHWVNSSRSGQTEGRSSSRQSTVASDSNRESAARDDFPEQNDAGSVRQAGIRAAFSGLTVSNRPAWQWRQLESEDYRTYINNLRSVGCPEQTVRDIVSADLFQGFEGRRAEIAAARYHDFEYWKADPNDSQARRVFESERHALDSEMGNVFTKLLGKDVVPPSTSDEWRAAELTQELAFLPQDKRDQVKTVLLKYAPVDEQMKDLAANEKITEDASQREQMVTAYDEKKAELKGLP
jgi:hypothetical protein